MHEKSDAQLLRDYAQHGDEIAFAELVSRHTNLVYSAAARQVDSPDIAAEVAQSVFLGLARGARSLFPRLAEDASLAGWLCRSARNVSLNLRRDESRRHSRERQAMEHLDRIPETAPDWERLRPVLDAAMSELDETDYDALVMRFFKNQNLRSVGLALGVSDDTAQKRVSRALDKLREYLSRRGIRTTAAALSVVLTANAVQAAPVGLALTISSAAAIAGTTITTTATATATKAIAMTTLQKTLITATLAAAFGTGIYEARQASTLRTQVQTLQQQQAPLTEQIQQMQHERDEVMNRVASLADDLERSKSNSTELLKLRGEVGMLRRQNQALAQANAGMTKGNETQTLDKGFGTLGEYLSVEKVSDAGNSTAEALLETFVWAMREGKLERLEQIEAPFGGQSKPGDRVGEISEAQAAIFKTIQNVFTNSAGFRLSSKPASDGQKYEVRLDADPLRGNGSDEFVKNFHISFVLEQKPDGWNFGNPSEEPSSK